MTNSITSMEGSIELVDAPASMLPRLRTNLPLGVVPLVGRPDGVTTGIVSRCGGDILHAIVFPTAVRRHPGTAHDLGEFNRWWITVSLREYLKHRFPGVLLPAVYVKPRTRTTWETGLACFAFPEQEDRGTPLSDAGRLAMAGIETGAMHMATAFAHVFQKNNKDAGFEGIRKEKPQVLPIHALGHLNLDFLVVDQNIVCVKPTITVKDRICELLIKDGYKGPIIHLPSVFKKIESEELAEAIGSSAPLCCSSPPGLTPEPRRGQGNRT